MKYTETVNQIVVTPDWEIIPLIDVTTYDDEDTHCGVVRRQKIYKPIDDISTAPDQVKTIAGKLWTPEIIASYQIKWDAAHPVTPASVTIGDMVPPAAPIKQSMVQRIISSLNG